MGQISMEIYVPPGSLLSANLHCVDSDQAAEADVTSVVDYDQLEGVSVEQAVAWANQQPCPVTLYLYDEGKGTTSEGHFNEVAHRF